jgi:hypothetical protein
LSHFLECLLVICWFCSSALILLTAFQGSSHSGSKLYTSKLPQALGPNELDRTGECFQYSYTLVPSWDRFRTRIPCS